jgi:uncharacterized protein (TIGR02271 family)
MALFKIADFNPNYREDAFEGEEIKGYQVYAGETEEKVGTVKDILVDESGRFRYLVVDTGVWVLGKKVLLPVGRARFNMATHSVYALGLTSKEEAENLPRYEENMTVDWEYEEQVRGIYRSEDADKFNNLNQASYTYDHEPELYQMNESDQATFKLYEEKLVTSKERRQTGEVAVGKHIETETAQASVPVENEKIIIERKSPAQAETPVTPDEVKFEEGEIARMEVYEETAEISKEAVVREEVSVKKEVSKDTVEAEETLRREELDVDVEGNPVIQRNS